MQQDSLEHFTLTDEFIVNIRSNIFHGISPIKDFNSSYASLVFHALLWLSVATKELKKGNEVSESN
jgi:hypothetical protein